jgi:hypothetical protein
MTPSLRVSVFIYMAITLQNIVAGNFLRDGPTFPTERLSVERLKSSLQRQIEAGTGHNTSHDVMERIENELRPTFAALPKNRHGNLGPTTARYALDRAFRRRHGWQLQGLEPTSGFFNSTSPTGILKDRVPRYIEELFEERLHGKGFGLHELAVFIATIERLAAEEAIERLKGAYSIMKVSEDTTVSSEQMDRIMEAYMMVTVLGQGNLSSMSKSEYQESLNEMKDRYSSWAEVQDLAKQIRRDIVYAPFTLFSSSDMYTFATSTRVVEELSREFGKFQDKECQAMKSSLLKVEERRSGRVRLGSFYAQTLGDAERFSEAKDYLRELNALDEFEKNRPRVIISNYVVSASNCIGGNGLYSICCSNECEGILSHLEHYIGGPSALPKRIANIVSALPSSTMPANRQLSESLMKHLYMVAKQHQGRVPLHSRLFQQWLHHAYPRECAMPSPIGKLKPMTESEWLQAKNQSITASEEEMKQAIADQEGNMTEEERALSEIGREELDDLPWTTEEELVVIQETYKHADLSFWSICRNLAFIGIIGASWAYMLDTVATSLAGGPVRMPGKPTYGKK